MKSLFVGNMNFQTTEGELRAGRKIPARPPANRAESIGDVLTKVEK